MNAHGVLFIVATPIGNLEDITLRALSVLKRVEYIAAEDTRHSQRLLNHFGITAKLLPYHDHGSDAQLTRVLGLLTEGHDVALVSDAGTPLISDPGYRVVVSAREQAIRVVPIPGVSAPITALSACGLPTYCFSFEGFLPHKSSARLKRFEAVKECRGTTIFFESPHRVVDSIVDAIAVLGENRPAVLAREMTKTFETFLGGTLGEIHSQQKQDSNQARGELVLLIGESEVVADNADISFEVTRIIEILIKTLSTKQASVIGSEITGVPKKRLYDYILSLK